MTTTTRALATAVVLYLGWPSWTIAQTVSGARGNVRGCSANAEDLLDEAYAKSLTVQRLVDALDQTDVVVYVEFQPLAHLDGQLKFAGTSGGYRYVRISIKTTLRRSFKIAVLAHELQHAHEVAQAPNVTTQRKFGDLFERIGYRAEFGYETRDAQGAQSDTTSELAAEATSHPANVIRD